MPTMFHQRFKSEQQRFEEKYDVLPNGCWQWRGKDLGYPKFWVGGGYLKAHRYALQGKIGRPLNAGEEACHRCDNVRCVNPAHLFVGTHTDNMRDRASKGRGNERRGVSNGRALLDDEQVREMRKIYAIGLVSQEAIAAMFGVKQVTVSHIVRGHTWKHLQDD